MIPRRRTAWTPLLAGVVAAVLLGGAGLMLLTRTEPGRERILGYTLETLGGQLNGELLVARLEGDLFTGARLYDITLRDHLAREMVTADSAFLQYRLATFFGGDVVINQLVLYDADVLLYRLPGDSLWNYQAVLQDTTRERTGTGRATIIDELRLVNAEVTVRMPWEPDDDLSEREQRRELAAALSDTSRLVVEEVPGGYLRTMYLRTPEAVVGELAVASDERGGTYLRVLRGTGEVRLYRGPPIRLRGLEGELGLREGVLRYRAPTIVLPESRLESAGVVDLRGEEPAYDLRVLGREVALRDLQWLYPAFPDTGRAEFDLRMETRPDGLLFRMHDLALAAPGTRLTGSFGLVFGDTLLFSDVSLTAEPLDVATVEQMLPARIPVRGLQIGAVEIRSPAS